MTKNLTTRVLREMLDMHSVEKPPTLGDAEALLRIVREALLSNSALTAGAEAIHGTMYLMSRDTAYEFVSAALDTVIGDDDGQPVR